MWRVAAHARKPLEQTRRAQHTQCMQFARRTAQIGAMFQVVDERRRREGHGVMHVGIETDAPHRDAREAEEQQALNPTSHLVPVRSWQFVRRGSLLATRARPGAPPATRR